MHQKHISGFSLIELLITIAVVAILLALGLPSFQDALRSNRVATATNQLIASFSLARTEAIRSASGSGLCTSTDGEQCDGDWDDGWMVWTDVNGSGALDVGEPVIRYVQGNAQLTATAEADGGASPTDIVFDRRGRVFAAGGGEPMERRITLLPEVCPAGLPLQRTLTLSPTGQYRVDKENCP